MTIRGLIESNIWAYKTRKFKSGKHQAEAGNSKHTPRFVRMSFDTVYYSTARTSEKSKLIKAENDTMDDLIFICVSLTFFCILNTISLKFLPTGRIDDKSTLVQVMAEKVTSRYPNQDPWRSLASLCHSEFCEFILAEWRNNSCSTLHYMSVILSSPNRPSGHTTQL